MDKQCNPVTKSCYFNIRKIGRIRPYISEDARKTLVNSLMASRLDNGNALLYGVNKQLTNKLQQPDLYRAHGNRTTLRPC